MAEPKLKPFAGELDSSVDGPWSNYSQSSQKSDGPWDQYAGLKPFDGSLDVAPPSGTAPSLARSAGDSAIALGTGVVQGVKMLTDVAGAGNAASRALGSAADALTDLESPYRKAQKQERAAKIKTAEQSGSTWDEVKAHVGAFADAPIDTTLNALGTSLPTLAAAAVPGLGQAALAARAAQAGVGVAQGVGNIKGQIHEAVKQKHLEAGASEADATRRADAAQAYGGDNTGAMALGGALGGIAGSTGAESAVRGLMGRKLAGEAAERAAPGLIRSAVAGAAKEAPMEAAQGGQERLASNVALQGEGFDVPTWQGVAGQAAVEGLASAPMGGGFGVVQGVQQRAQQQAAAQARQNAEAAAADAQAKADATVPQWDTEPGAAGPSTMGATGTASAAHAPGAAEANFTTSPGASGPREGGVDFTREVDTSGLSLEDPAEVERARAAMLDYEPVDATPQWDTERGAAPGGPQGLEMEPKQFDTGSLAIGDPPAKRQLGYSPLAGTPAVFPDGSVALGSEAEFARRYAPQPAQRPSEAMGLDPAAGPLSRIAVQAVDSGAYMPPAGQAPALAPEPDPVVLQNRDRTSAASIAQMQEIAANPDYLRVGPSRDMTSGAPVVFGELPPTALLGRPETVVDGHGQRMGTQYAVVDALDLIASNNADGTTVAEYATGAPGKLRSVAGNGRTAGLQAAYQLGTAQRYRQELAGDAAALGVDAQALATMQRPVLVRVMQGADVTRDMGDRTNITATQKLSPLEQAGNDARRLDVGTLAFDEGGNPTPDAIKGFVSAMPVAERGDMLNPDGTPTRQAVDRLMAATFKQAYESDELVQLYAQATDPDARAVMAAAADASGVLANLKGAGEFDVRGAVADAAKMAVNAARQGLKLSDVLQNQDLDMSPEAYPVAAYLAQHIRTPKKMAEGLRRWGQLALEQARIADENTHQGSLLGPRPTLSRPEIFARLGSEANPTGQGIEPAAPAPQPAPEQAALVPPAQAAPTAAERHPTWRQNAIQAGRVALALGLEPKGKRLAQIVAEIDARDSEQNQPVALAKPAQAATDSGADAQGAGAMFSRAGAADQTQTEAFKKWFGDSKVVDAQGEPLAMYHGTSGNEGGDAFTYFDAYASNYGLMGQGAYFTDNPEVASSYTTKGKGDTPTVYKALLSIQNPIDMDAKADPAKWQEQFDGIEDFHEGGDTNESWYRAAEDLLRDQALPMWEGAEAMQDGLRAMGHDGITHIGGGRVKSDGVRHRVYIAFEPTQVKSATGNNGEFDGTNSDIRFSRAQQPMSPDLARAILALGSPPKQATKESVRAAVRELVNGLGLLPNRLGRIVVATSAEIKLDWEPLIGPTGMEASGDAGRAQGFYDPKSKTVFLIADNIRQGDELGVVAHELMHKHGPAVLGEEGWNRLHGALGGWAKAKLGSMERIVYDEAVRRVRASGPELSTQELFPYAVQVALEMGVRPNAVAPQGTVERWLGQVRAALRQVWDKITRKPELFKSQDLVNLAFGIAQRENPEHAGELDGAVGAAKDNLLKPNDPLFSRAAPTANPGAAGWAAPSASQWDDFVYKLQDKHIDTKRVLESIRATGKAIADDLDVYLQEELYHGRAAKRTQDFVSNELEPLMKYMADSGLKMQDVQDYLHARHAKEANRVVAQRNPGLPDGGSGMTDAEADAVLASFNTIRRAQLERAAARVDAMIAGTRQAFVEYGLESQDTVDGWAKTFAHYVPLMREQDGDGMAGLGTGQGFSIKGREVKGRTGSTRKVVDILANIAMQRERAIVRGEKNRVATALVGLAQGNPSALWQVDVVPTRQTLDKKTGMVTTQHDPLYKQRDNVVVAKIPALDKKTGKVVVKEHAVVFDEGDARAMRMATALKNLDAPQLEGLLGATAQVTRYLAAINTQYNPIFGVTNLARDVQGAALNLAATPLAGKQREVLGQALSALAGIYSDERARTKGKGGTQSQWAQLWEEFQSVGGQTGYRDQFRTSADRGQALARALDPSAWTETKWGQFFTAGGRLKVPMEMARKAMAPVFAWLDDYNTAMENGVRLAAYKTARDAGMSKERAASLAKNLTTNFNRKGQSATQVGALYAFFNASVQGTARIGQTLFDMEPGQPKTLRLSAVGKKIVAGGVLLGSMQALLLAAAGFDDEEPPDFVRERNLVIPTGGKTYLTIPMPLGFHVLPNLGRIPAEFALSGFSKPAEHVLKLIGLFSDTFNPIGNAGLSMQTLAPTVLDPLAALAENKDFSGRAIAKESFNKMTPGHALARDTASLPALWLAEGINYLTGGTRHVRGALSPTPDQIDYLVGQVTGGVGREATKAMQTAQATASGDDLPAHKVPLLGRFYGNADSPSAKQAAFYRHLDEVDRHAEQVKGLRLEGKGAEALAYAQEHPQARLHMAARAAQRQIKDMRERRRELEQQGASREEVRALEQRMTQRMEQFNALAAL